MKKEQLTITFESHDAKEDFISWLRDEGEDSLCTHLEDSNLDALRLDFINGGERIYVFG